MTLFMLFCLFICQSQGYEVDLQSNVDVGNELASIIQDLINYYLPNSSVSLAGIDIGELIKKLHISPVDYIPSAGKPEHSEENKDLTVITEFIKKEIKNGKKRKPLEKDSHSLQKSYEDDTEDSFENENDESKTPNRGGTEEELITEQDAYDENYETNNEAKTVKRDNREKKRHEKDKTFLEEIIEMQDNVHVYGKHNDKTDNVPLNNIRT